MSASPHLQKRQFSGARKRSKKDPGNEEKPSFGGGRGSKTMKVEKGRGLPPSPSVHPHRNHAGSRTRRAR